jgi:molecular chaperone HscC
VLGSLKADAEAFLSQAVDEAVITVPAYFNDTQRKATKAAGELAGFTVKHLLTEPTAAALAYGLEAVGDERIILVADLGGGTFDVSVLQCFEGVMEVRAAAGDSWLGGEDFVDAIVAEFMAGPGRQAGLPPPSSAAPVHGALRRQAEVAKRKLSEANEAAIEVVHEGRLLSWSLTRDAFERLSEPLLARLRGPIERALRDSRIDPDALSQIVLAGGASRMSMFRRLISRLFGRLPMQYINPEEVVAQGAAMRAGLSMHDASLKEIVLTDVVPFTLGIAVSERDPEGGVIEGFFLPVIERNSHSGQSRKECEHNQRQPEICERGCLSGRIPPRTRQHLSRIVQRSRAAGASRQRSHKCALYL